MALQDYKLLRQLGSSAASEVWYALDSDGRPVVVKLLKRKNYPADVRRFEHEAACAERLVSPHVAQVRESGMEPQLFIVFEYIHGKDLAEVAPIRDLREYLKTAVAIAAGLAAIHEQGIAHRDIKPENVRYERHGHAKIIDLGIALTKREGDRQSRCEDPPGTQGWMAPERGQGQLLEVAAEQKADIFSTGLLLSYLRTGIHPFGMDRREIDNSAVQQEIDNPAVQPELARVDEHLRVLFSKTLEREPTRRPEAKELLRVLLRLAQHQPGSLWRRIGRIGEPIRKLTGSRRKSVLVVVVLLATLGLLTYVLFPKIRICLRASRRLQHALSDNTCTIQVTRYSDSVQCFPSRDPWLQRDHSSSPQSSWRSAIYAQLGVCRGSRSCHSTRLMKATQPWTQRASRPIHC